MKVFSTTTAIPTQKRNTARSPSSPHHSPKGAGAPVIPTPKDAKRPLGGQGICSEFIRVFKALRIALALLLIFPLTIQAADKILLPEEVQNTEIYLLTVDLGSDLHARFGHTMLRVVNPHLQIDHCFNWGLFDFNDPIFAVNFFLGKLRYWGGAFRTQGILESYRQWEIRAVREQQLNLTQEQKTQLLKQAFDSIRPENRYFWYDYFFHNCATIPVVMISKTLDGRIEKTLREENTDQTFRKYIRKNLNQPPVVAFFLDILMNNRIDRPLTKWDEMFYPIKVEEYLNEFSQGEQKLLGPVDVLVDVPRVNEASWHLHPWFCLCGLLLGLVAFWQRRVFKIYSAVLTILFATLGSVMTLAWAFSLHLDLHHNANLLFFWPIDWLFLFSRRFAKTRRALSIAHLVMNACGTALYALGFITQDVGLVVWYTIPVSTLFYAQIARSTITSES